MSQDLGSKKLKLKWGDIRVWSRRDLMAIQWMETPTEGNFCHEWNH